MLTIKIMHKNEIWYKIIAHDILYKPFQKNMQKLQAEIETYNKIRLAQAPVWINKNRQGKYTTSAVINVKSLKKAQLIMQGLNIAAMRYKVVRYENIKFTTKCNKC